MLSEHHQRKAVASSPLTLLCKLYDMSIGYWNEGEETHFFVIFLERLAQQNKSASSNIFRKKRKFNEDVLSYRVR